MRLEIKELRGGYDGPDVVKGISCSLQPGEILSVLGPNGSGKTTFFRLLLGFLSPTGGDVLMDGHSTKAFTRQEFARRIAYIPQHHTPAFSYTVFEVVLMGRASHLSAFESPGPRDRERAFEALKLLKILPLAHKKYTALSGGERQLVLIARAICQDADILVMDEPDSSLDYANHRLLMDVTQGLAEKGYGIILSSHSPEHPFSVAHKVLLLKEGKVAAYGPPKEAITAEILLSVYGTAMELVTITDRKGKEHTLCIPV